MPGADGYAAATAIWAKPVGGMPRAVAHCLNAEDVQAAISSIQRRLPCQAHRLIPLLLSVQVPVVCAVRGWAAGIGLHLAVAADFTVAAEDARFWEPFAERGFTPDSGGTWLLPRRVGEVSPPWAAVSAAPTPAAP